MRRISWALQLVRIYEKGRDARRAGEPRESCPYRGNNGNLQRQRRAYWLDGWERGEEATDSTPPADRLPRIERRGEYRAMWTSRGGHSCRAIDWVEDLGGRRCRVCGAYAPSVAEPPSPSDEAVAAAVRGKLREIAMGRCGATIEEIRFDLRDPDLTQVYVLVRAEGDCPLGVQGWHHKTFAARVPVAEILPQTKDYLLWTPKSPD